MVMSNEKWFNRIIAIVAVLATVFVVLISGLFITEKIHHKCDDEAHCPVCALILQCEQNIKTIGSALIVAATSIALAEIFVEVATAYEYQSVQTTLVSSKVRMDS